MFRWELLCLIDFLKLEVDKQNFWEPGGIDKIMPLCSWGESAYPAVFEKARLDWRWNTAPHQTTILAYKKQLWKGLTSPQPHKESEPDWTNNLITDRLDHSKEPFGHNVRKDAIEFCSTA